MKNQLRSQMLFGKKYIFLLLALSGFFLACNENMPVIDCLSCEDNGGGGGPTGPQVKNVLIEEFTGVRCIGCPAGSTEIQNLISQSNGRLVAVSIHAGFFSLPYPENDYDFRTDGGTSILNFLGQPEANPAAVVDRKQFPGEADLQFVNTSAWAGIISQQYDEMAKLSMTLENTYNENNRTLTMKVSGESQELITEEVKLTIMITESGIVDNQLTPESSPDSNPDYVHNHVLRKVITAFEGDVIASTLGEGATFEETYTFIIPNDWVVADCEVIAFTHLSESNKEVLQAVQEHLAD